MVHGDDEEGDVNTQDYLQFLEQRQPMMDDPPVEVMTRYKAATAHFYRHPDPACIPLFLGSFAEWGDFSVYESVQSVLCRFPKQIVIPHLIKAMASPHRAVRLWSADTARAFADDALAPALVQLLAEPGLDMRLVAASALECIDSDAARAAADQALKTEREEEVREILEAAASP